MAFAADRQNAKGAQMPSPTDFDAQIQAATVAPFRQGALALEQLYRRAKEAGHADAFREAIERALPLSEKSALLDAWGCRLDILPLEQAVAVAETARRGPAQVWGLAISLSVILGVIWLLFSGAKPPVPSPEVASPLFWLGWAPAAAVVILAFIGAASREPGRRPAIVAACSVIIALSFLSWWLVGGRKDSASILAALHLPILAWMAVGVASTARFHERPAQRIAFILKSAEALIASGIYVAGAGVFGALTLGIFDVLGVHFSESWISRCAALVLGMIPVLGIASTIDPGRSPAGQDYSTGAARLMRLMTRLLLTPVLGVLAVYVLWFIPRYFWRPFEERAVLIIYNASLAAVLLLVVLSVPYLNEEISAFWSKSLRRGIRAVCALAMILNLYSLSAVVVRTLRYGLSPNRHATIGWNVVTLCILASITVSQFRASTDDWRERFQTSFARFLPLAALWALWVLLVSPWI
jgi:hypothetical protein